MSRWGHAAKRRVVFVEVDEDAERTLSPDEEERTESSVSEDTSD